jgi:hypothetical protein
MRPRERRDSGGHDLFRARLDQIIDLDHELAKLARAIDWRFLEQKFGGGVHRPPRPATAADPADGRPRHSQAHLRSSISATKWCAHGGSRTRIISISAARNSSDTPCRWIAPRSPAGATAWARSAKPGCRRAWRSRPAPAPSSHPISTASSSTPRCSRRTSPSRPMPSF